MIAARTKEAIEVQIIKAEVLSFKKEIQRSSVMMKPETENPIKNTANGKSLSPNSTNPNPNAIKAGATKQLLTKLKVEGVGNVETGHTPELV